MGVIALELTSLHEKLYPSFDDFKFFVREGPCEAWKFTGLAKLLALIHTEFSNFRCTYLCDTHSSENNSKVLGSGVTVRVDSQK